MREINFIDLVFLTYDFLMFYYLYYVVIYSKIKHCEKVSFGFSRWNVRRIKRVQNTRKRLAKRLLNKIMQQK